jgi:hypothetical protein
MTPATESSTTIDDAWETGRFGPPSLIENDAFTLQGQGPETAARERDIRWEIRQNERNASRHPQAQASSKSSKSTSKS